MRRAIDWSKPEEAHPEGPTPRDLKRRASRHAAEESEVLVERLMELKPEQVGEVPLDPEQRALFDEIMSKRADSGRRRLMRNLAALLRDADREPVIEGLKRVEAGKGIDDARFRGIERLRTVLLEGGDAAVEELLQRHRGADRTRLFDLVHKARTERAEQRPPRFYRELFRVLRELEG
ncbi:MAG: ribosome biogenesis factor YjgA [Bradymonadia bacterium]|jgi:ribosome-associated protein